MNWTSFLIGLGSSAVGSLGFALIFRLRPRYLAPAAIGGTLAFAVYYLLDVLGLHIFASNFFAAIVGALYSELCARILKAPSVVFTIPCIIPLVPGSLLYYTMSHLIAGAYGTSLSYLSKTLLTALGIAGGMIVVSVFFSVLQYLSARRAAKKNAASNKKTL